MPRPDYTNYVKCVDCARGYYGEKSCSAGRQIKKRSRRAAHLGCFCGKRLEEKQEAEKKS